MFLVSVTGALVAFGIMAQTYNFLLFTAAIIPALYLTGLLAIIRLVGTESMQSEVTIARIRRYYRSLGAPADTLFEEPLGRWPEGSWIAGISSESCLECSRRRQA